MELREFAKQVNDALQLVDAHARPDVVVVVGKKPVKKLELAAPKGSEGLELRIVV